jgi:hypothetical protein
MSTTPRVIAADQDTFVQKTKNLAGAAFFLLIRKSPKLLEIYRNEKAWTLFRVALACLGAAMVLLPLALWTGYFTAAFGLIVFVVAVLLPPADLESPTDRKAQELGAKTVISGGEYAAPGQAARNVQLFVSPAHAWALDKDLTPLVVMITAEIKSLRVEPAKRGESLHEEWVLHVWWGNHKAEFVYKGVFAERFARLAEESLRLASAEVKSSVLMSRSARA